MQILSITPISLLGPQQYLFQCCVVHQYHCKRIMSKRAPGPAKVEFIFFVLPSPPLVAFYSYESLLIVPGKGEYGDDFCLRRREDLENTGRTHQQLTADATRRGSMWLNV